jgi:hypothetical protein
VHSHTRDSARGAAQKVAHPARIDISYIEAGHRHHTPQLGSGQRTDIRHFSSSYNGAMRYKRTAREHTHRLMTDCTAYTYTAYDMACGCGCTGCTVHCLGACPSYRAKCHMPHDIKGQGAAEKCKKKCTYFFWGREVLYCFIVYCTAVALRQNSVLRSNAPWRPLRGYEPTALPLAVGH